MARILVDAAVYGAESFAEFGELECVAGEEIESMDLRGVEAIVTRTVTRVDAELIARAPDLRFVGSASAGFDHVDGRALAKRRIEFAHAAGCNAEAVAQWVVSALLVEGKLAPGVRVGIVGVGHVGRALVALLRPLGVELMLCDPPRFEAGELAAHRSLAELGEACDLLSFHVPLTRAPAAHPTLGMVDAATLRAWLAAGKTVINSSRGAVFSLPDPERLDGLPGSLCLDVWPGEPEIDWRYLQGATRPSVLRLATPHIAGYTLEAKRRATAMVRHALAESWGRRVAPAPTLGRASDAEVDASLPRSVGRIAAFARDEASLVRVAQLPQAERAAAFGGLRANYALRRDWSAHVAHPRWPADLARAWSFLPPQ